MVTTGAAIVFLLPVEPLGISDRVLPGTGMCDSHVECRALTYRSERTQDLTEPGIENKTRTYFVIRPRRFQARCRQRQEKGRSEERRVGKDGVSTGRSRWSPKH